MDPWTPVTQVPSSRHAFAERIRFDAGLVQMSMSNVSWLSEQKGWTVESQSRFSKVHKHLKIQTEANPTFQIIHTGQVINSYWL